MTQKLAVLILIVLATGVAPGMARAQSPLARAVSGPGAMADAQPPQPTRPLARYFRRPEDAGLSDNALGAIIVAVGASAFGWAVWVVATNIRRSRAAAKAAELHNRLLDRFTGNQELIAFLEGESGRRYFEAMELDVKDPVARILNGVQLGIVLLLLGASLLLVRFALGDEMLRVWFLVCGVPIVALGAGFLISAAVSHRLSESWGLLQRNGR